VQDDGVRDVQCTLDVCGRRDGVDGEDDGARRRQVRKSAVASDDALAAAASDAASISHALPSLPIGAMITHYPDGGTLKHGRPSEETDDGSERSEPEAKVPRRPPQPTDAPT
jgi:hypothetical protein